MATSHLGRKIGAGAALAAGAAAAGYYFYGSDKAQKHRVAAAKWAVGLKNDVVKEARMLSKIDKKKVSAVVDSVVRTYRSAKKADGKELGKAAAELKKNWHHLALELKPLAGRAVSKGKGALKKAGHTLKRSGKKILKNR